MSGADVELDEEDIEGGATRPPMWLGLPRKLSALLGGIGAESLIIFSDLTWQAGSVAAIAMVWGAARLLVSRDYHGFDNFLAWLSLDARCLEVREWGGARLSSFPLRPRFHGSSSDVDY